MCQFILLFSGCRVHSLSGLQKKNCSTEGITIYDTKTQKMHLFELSDLDFRLMFQDFISDLNEEDFVFFKNKCLSTKQNILTYRSKYMSARIKKEIIASKMFHHVDIKKETLSAHMFRKTKAMNIYQESVNSALNNVRNAIGQSENTNAIFHYISIDPVPPKMLFQDIIRKLNEDMFRTDKSNALQIDFNIE